MPAASPIVLVESAGDLRTCLSQVPARADWMLMHTIGRGIQPRGEFGEAHSRVVLEAAARMHADYPLRDEELAAPETDRRSLALKRGDVCSIACQSA